MLRSWNVYQEQNGCISIRIRFDSCGEPAKHDDVTYKRKAPSQVARDRRRSDQWSNKKAAHKQQPGSPRHTSTHGMKTRRSSNIELLRCDDSTECGDICSDMLCTPSILNPLATPFPHQHDVYPDYVSYVSPSPGPALPKLAVDTPDESEQLEDITTTSLSLDPNTADVNDTSSDATDSDIDTTINCGKYWCSYGGGKSDQDKSHDGLFTCARWKYHSVCILCMNDGRHARHKQYLVPDSDDWRTAKDNAKDITL